MHTGDAEDAYRRCLNLGRVVVPLPIVDEVQGLNTLGIPLVLATRAAYGRVADEIPGDVPIPATADAARNLDAAV